MASEEFETYERQNELLRITETAVSSLVTKSLHGQANAGVRNMHQSSIVPIGAPGITNEEASSNGSYSTTTSKVLINATNPSARQSNDALNAPGLPNIKSPRGQTSQIVRMPANALREVSSPCDDSLPHDDYIVDASDEKIVNISVSRRQPRPSGSLTTAPTDGRSDSARLHSSSAGKSASVPLGKKTAAKSQEHQMCFNKTLGEHFNSHPVPVGLQSKVSRAIPPLPDSVPTSNAATLHQPPVRDTKKDAAHPLMVMLDSGYLTQPIYTVVAEEKAASLSSNDSSSSPIIVHAKNMELSQTESDSSISSRSGSIQPEIITVSGVTMPVLPGFTPSVDGSETEGMSARPFVALKDRFHQFRPISVKQGMETSDSSTGPSLGSVERQGNELRIEQFALNDKQNRLRQEFVHRKGSGSSGAVKKVVPAHVVPASHPSTAADAKPLSDTVNEVKSSATSADAVATAAVAAVVATQTFMKTQQDLERQMSEVLSKISTLQEASQRRSESADLAVNIPPSSVAYQTDPESDKYHKKLEELEAQLTSVTRQRLDYLERLQQQHFDIQMQLLAMGRQNASTGHTRSHTYDNVADKPSAGHVLGPPARNTKSDTSLSFDIDREKASLLDTPAPRRQRPIPTFYEPVHTRPTATASQDIADQHQMAPKQYTPQKHDTTAVGPSVLGRQSMFDSSSTAPQTSDEEALARLNKARSSQSATKQLNDTFSLTPEKRNEPAPLDKYLALPMKSDVDISPYPMLKKRVASHMPALLQYAEVEAVLKKVHATSNRLETNLNMVLKARQDLDFMDGYSNDDNGSLAERIRIRKLVDERVQAIAKKLEVEIEEEQLRLQNEKNRRMMEAERDVSKVKRSRVALSYRDRASRSAEVAAPKTVRAVAEKENIPKRVPVRKPRPLDPVQDEEYMKRIYGKALYHKQRNIQEEACERYHSSSKSKLPRSPVNLSRAVVKGIEVATAKTQTSSSAAPFVPTANGMHNGGRGVKGQFVVGLQGKLIPVAIPVELPVQQDYGQYGRPSSRPPPRRSSTPSRTPSPVKEIPLSILQDKVENEDDEPEEEEPESFGEQQPISLPGYTAPPIHYDGPEFPIRAVPHVREPEPETTADELAAKIKRADKLQTEVVDWVEQELMARIISEMYEKRSVDPLHYGTTVATRKSSEDFTDRSSVLSDAGADESFMADAIGQHGVQMFVDAGRPVDDDLVAALVCDVLAEKIAAMLGERAELNRLARREPESRQLPVPVAVSGNVSQPPRAWKSPVATPQPTPVQSPAPSRSRSPSPMSTPLASMAAVPIPVELVQPTEAKEASEDTDDFPSYTGVSDIESEKEAISLPFVERHDVNTPSVTPSRSPVPSLGTPSLSQEFVPPPPAVAAALTSPPPVVADVKDASVECQLLPLLVQPASPSTPVSPRVPSPDTESASTVPPTEEESTTNMDGVSEGQWLINVLSEGEVPDMQLNEGLKNRIKQHLMNASRRRQSLDTDDTIAASDELDQDDQTENLPSDGEILHDCRPMAEDAALLEVLKPRYSEAPAAVARMASPTRRKPIERYRSMGEVSIGEAIPVGNFEDDVHRRRQQAKRLGSSDGEQLISRQSSGEFQADNGLSTGEDRREAFRLPNQSPTASLSDAESPPQAARQPSPSNGKFASKRRPTAGPVRSTQDPAKKNHLGRGVTMQSSLYNRAPASYITPGNRLSVEAAGDQYSRTATPDQMNTDVLLASDYFKSMSDFGATASSNVELKAGNLRATFSPLNTGDSMQYQTDERESTGGWPDEKGGDDLGRSMENPDDGDNRVLLGTYQIGSSSSRPKLDITLPGASNNEAQSGSDDDDVSEFSNEP